MSSMPKVVALCRSAASLELLVLVGCHAITEEQLKSDAALLTSLQSLYIVNCFLLTKNLMADVHVWAPESLAALEVDGHPYRIEVRRGCRIAVPKPYKLEPYNSEPYNSDDSAASTPTREAGPCQRQESREALEPYDERLRYSREELQSIAAGIQQSGAACAALVQVVQSLNLAADK